MALSFISKITDLFRGAVTGSGSASVLGIDIGASSAKIVQLRPSKGIAILETYGEIALGPYAEMPIGRSVKLTPEKTTEALLDLIREANVTARQGGISIPFSSSLITVLEMPQTDSEQLSRMIPIEARKYIPLPMSEVTLDWFVIPGDDATDAFDRVEPSASKVQSVQEVLLAAIHNSVLQAYQTISAASSIAVKFFEIEIFSTIRSSLSRGVAPFLVMDMGASSTKVYVVERGVVRMSHLITQGGMQMTEILGRTMEWDFEKAERIKREVGLTGASTFSPQENARIKEALLSTLGSIFSEANRVLLSYGKRYNKNVSRVVMSGGGASLLGLLPEAKQALGVDVEIADPFSRTEAPAFLQDVLKDIGPSFSVAAGVALRELRQNG